MNVFFQRMTEFFSLTLRLVFSSVVCFLFCLNSISAQINLDSTYRISDIELLLKEARESNNRGNLAAAYFLLAEFEANSFDNAGNPLRNYQNARDYYVLLKDTFMMSRVDKSMGIKYMKAGYYPEALESLQRALDYFRRSEN